MTKYLISSNHLKLQLLSIFHLLSLTCAEEFNTNSSVINSTSKSINYNADCSDPNCMKCNTNGCMKCSKLIMVDSRKCVMDCPQGYIHQWSSTSEFMGRICYPSNISNSIQTVFIGVVCGAILCFIIVFVGLLVFKRKQYKMHKKTIKESLIDDDYSKQEFFKQLDDLRPHAECFLHMLNDTRKQIRKLHVAGDSSAAKYYPIIRDLAKILILLNRPVELIDGPPHDWNRLLLWAERILAQYKPEITQLINFLQTPTPQSDDSRFASKHTTFKSLFYSTPTSHGGPATSKDYSKRSSISEDIRQLSLPNEKEKATVGSLISLQDFDDRHLSPFGDSFNHVQNYLSNGSLFIEDEFLEFELGTRPQDELTTEL